MGSNLNRWSETEDSIITRPDLSLGVMAEMTGRSYRAVHVRRVRLKEKGVFVPPASRYTPKTPRHCEEHATRATGCPKCQGAERIYARAYRSQNREHVRAYKRDWAHRTRADFDRPRQKSGGRSQTELDALTRPLAVNAFAPWGQAELEMAMREDLSIMQIAIVLGRTYNEVQNRRANTKRGRRPRRRRP